ncbi:MAG TPA: hypothetical protein VIU64_23600 [Polyangia bacterium]
MTSTVVAAGITGCATASRPSATADSADEAKLMESLRQKVKSAPAGALADAEQAEARYGESPFAEERRALAIQALAGLDRIGEARSRAYQFVDRYPSGPYTAQVQALTGVHPSPPVGPQK